jgi:streptomycin 6-kinase
MTFDATPAGFYGSATPVFDDGARVRLEARFGLSVDAWFDELPALLKNLGERWQLRWGPPIALGTVSVVLRCQDASGRSAVLKVSPDRPRIAHETRSLRRWDTPHAPSVLAFDEQAGALLIEAIEPGEPLVRTGRYPALEDVAALLRALHAGRAAASYPTLEDRVRALFTSCAALYDRHPDIHDRVPAALYERGRRLALRLARDGAPAVLVHGDLTPSNVLDGAIRLVAVDPAPCVGDGAFDAVDLLLWQLDDPKVLVARAEALATAGAGDAQRMLDWCTAFAGMTALDLACAPDTPAGRFALSLDLAERAPAERIAVFRAGR